AATPQLGAATTRTAPRTQLLPPPMVHVIAVPGLGMSLPAPQRLVPEPVHLAVATPKRSVAVAPVPVTADGAVALWCANTANASSPSSGEIEILGFAELPFAVVPPAVGLALETPLKRIVARTCLAVPAARVAVMVWAPPGIAPWWNHISVRTTPAPLEAVPAMRLRVTEP